MVLICQLCDTIDLEVDLDVFNQYRRVILKNLKR